MTVTVAPASAVPLMVGLAVLVNVALVTEGALGAAVSMVTVSAVEALEVPLASLALAVSEWAPSLSEADVTVHRPSAPAVAVPSAVAPWYSTTVALAPAVPVIAGVATLVSLSAVEPLLEPAVSARPVGAAGGGGALWNRIRPEALVPIRASRSPSPSMSTKAGDSNSPTLPMPKGLVPARVKLGDAVVPTLR